MHKLPKIEAVIYPLYNPLVELNSTHPDAYAYAVAVPTSTLTIVDSPMADSYVWDFHCKLYFSKAFVTNSVPEVLTAQLKAYLDKEIDKLVEKTA